MAQISRSQVVVFCLLAFGIVGAFHLAQLRRDRSPRQLAMREPVAQAHPEPVPDRATSDGAPSTSPLAQNPLAELPQRDPPREPSADSPQPMKDPRFLQPSPTEIARLAIRDSVVRRYPIEKYPALLDEMLSQEEPDPARTELVRDEIARLLELSTDDVARIGEVTCGTSICKVTTFHGSSDEARQFWREAAEQQPLAGPGHRFTRPSGGSELRSTSYMASAGQDDAVHDALYDRIYKEVTGNEAANIQPTAEQITLVVAQLEGSPG